MLEIWWWIDSGGLDAALRSRDDGQLSQHEVGLGEAQPPVDITRESRIHNASAKIKCIW